RRLRRFPVQQRILLEHLRELRPLRLAPPDGLDGGLFHRFLAPFQRQLFAPSATFTWFGFLPGQLARQQQRGRAGDELPSRKAVPCFHSASCRESVLPLQTLKRSRKNVALALLRGRAYS